MLIAVISDTHMPRGGRRLPQSCVRRIAGADLLLHAGDFAELEVLEELERIGPPLLGVCGNVDSSELRACLPVTRIVEAVVFGHSHMPLHERAEDGFQIFNPGSPTERRRAPAKTMGLARVNGGRIGFELIPFPAS